MTWCRSRSPRRRASSPVSTDEEIERLIKSTQRSQVVIELSPPRRPPLRRRLRAADPQLPVRRGAYDARARRLDRADARAARHQLLFGRHVWDCAQHADLWGRRLPELRAAAQQSGRRANDAMVAFMEMLESPEGPRQTLERVVGVYTVLKPHL